MCGLSAENLEMRPGDMPVYSEEFESQEEIVNSRHPSNLDIMTMLSQCPSENKVVAIIFFPLPYHAWTLHSKDANLKYLISMASIKLNGEKFLLNCSYISISFL